MIRQLITYKLPQPVQTNPTTSALKKIIVFASYILLVITVAASLYIWGSNTIPTLKLVIKQDMQQYKLGKINIANTALNITGHSILVGFFGLFSDVEKIHNSFKALQSIDTSDSCSRKNKKE